MTVFFSICANLVPLYSYVAPLTTLSLIYCHYSVGNSFLLEEIQLTEEEEVQAKSKLQNRVLVYFSLFTIFLMKLWIHFSQYEMEQKLNKYDEMNKYEK